MRNTQSNQRVGEIGTSGHAQPPVVEKRSGTTLGGVELVQNWTVDNCGDKLAFALQRHRNREQGYSVQEIGGPVEWVDNPAIATVRFRG